MIKTIAKLACLALLVGGAGCKKDKKEKAKPEKDTAGKTTEKTEKAPAEEKAKLDTPEDKVAFYRACFDHLNAKAWDKFGGCYADNVVSEQVDTGMPAANGRDAAVANVKAFTEAFPDLKVQPTLILANGNKLASITTVTGTHTAALKGPMGEIPASDKKIGMNQLHIVEVDPAAGGAVKEWLFYDSGTMMGQIGLNPMPHRAAIEAPTGEPTIVIAKGDDVEKAALDLHKQNVEAWNKRDVKASAKLMAADAVMHDMAGAKDLPRKDADKMMAEIIKAFPDSKGETIDAWAAGDYVVSISRNSGTNKGPMPSMGLKKATGKAMLFTSGDVARVKDGKFVESWMFYNGMVIAKQLGLMPETPAAPPAGDKAAAPGGDKAPEGDKAAPAGDKAAADPHAGHGAEKKPAGDKAPAEGGAGGN
jgi:predicted ester cyclase